MAKCPKCRTEIVKPSKKWRYSVFVVEAFECTACGTKFREYKQNGKHVFALKFEKGKRFVKA